MTIFSSSNAHRCQFNLRLESNLIIVLRTEPYDVTCPSPRDHITPVFSLLIA
jgi:hypothetical protein